MTRNAALADVPRRTAIGLPPNDYGSWHTLLQVAMDLAVFHPDYRATRSASHGRSGPEAEPDQSHKS
jgi:hypothetical protein